MIRICLIFALCAVFPAGCSTAVMVSTSSCAALVEKTASRLDAGKMTYADLRSEYAGESGFFYIVGEEGRISYHPNQSLTGRDVSDVPQIKAILAKDRGVNTDTLGGLTRTVFFRRLSSGKMLCLSVASEELEGR